MCSQLSFGQRYRGDGKPKLDHEKYTERQKQILDMVQLTPELTMQEIGDRVGISRERVRQICSKIGINHVQLRKTFLQARKDAEKQAKEKRKHMWSKMMYIGLRQRQRHMARINQFGLNPDHHMPGQETVCRYAGCIKNVGSRGLCHSHYGTLRASGALWVRRLGRRICQNDNCYRAVYARNLCRCHYFVYMSEHRDELNVVLPHHNTSGYRGVSWRKNDNRWGVGIRHNGKVENLGSFTSKEQAARAYDTAARKYLGDSAKLNFPHENFEVYAERGIRGKDVGVSGEKYIVWSKKSKRWYVLITRNSERVWAGSFIDLNMAVQARNNVLNK